MAWDASSEKSVSIGAWLECRGDASSELSRAVFRKNLNEGLLCPECKNPVFVRLPSRRDFDVVGREIDRRAARVIQPPGFSHYAAMSERNIAGAVDGCSLYHGLPARFGHPSYLTDDAEKRKEIAALLSHPVIRDFNDRLVRQMHFVATFQQATSADLVYYHERGLSLFDRHLVIGMYPFLFPYATMASISVFPADGQKYRLSARGSQYVLCPANKNNLLQARIPSFLQLVRKRDGEWRPVHGGYTRFEISPSAACAQIGEEAVPAVHLTRRVRQYVGKQASLPLLSAPSLG